MTGKEVIKLRDQLAAQRSHFEGHWNELAQLYTPFNTINHETPDLLSGDGMFDSTPRQSAAIFANGLCSLVIPRDEQWFEFIPDKALENDENAKKWFRDVSEIALGYVESSNFYEEIQESIFESGAFGTCSLYCGELDEYGELCFLHQSIGTYFIAEDSKGRVNTHVRDLSLTADQAADEFGEDKLPPKIRRLVGKPEGLTERFQFVHVVTKRRGAPSEDASELEKLPWTDVVVARDGDKLVRESGLHDFNFACHRHAKHGKCVYGFGPGAVAKGDGFQLSMLNEYSDAATEKEVFPPLVAIASLKGEIAQGPYDVTYVDQNDGAGVDGSVRALHERSNLTALEKRMDYKEKAIRAAFFVELFQLFSLRAQERGPLTATEASLIAGEKLTQFSPVYGRFMNEMVDVVLSRVFSVLFRAGKFPVPPASVVNAKRTGRVRYRNKIALAMQAKENGALIEFFSLLLPVLQTFPEVGPVIFDSLRISDTVRDLLRNSGLPERWIASIDEYRAAQAGRAQAAQQRAQLENAELASKAAGNLGKAPPAILEQAQQSPA